MAKSVILVVDDEAFFRQLYSELLNDAEYEVETASSGEDALQRLRQGGVDVVLTDMVMPGIDGLEVLRESRNIENPPEVILVTGHATVETAIQALKSGARDYLVKPFNPNELLHLVRTCLEQRRLLDENTHLKNQIRLFRTGQFLASILDVETLFSQTISTVLRELRGGRGLGFVIGKNGLPEMMVRDGLDDDKATALVEQLMPRLPAISGFELLSGDDLPESSPALPSDLERLLVYPLRSQDETKGCLVLINPTEGDFPQPLPLTSISFLLEQMSLGFDNGYRYLGARELMYTDDLTGLHNYRYLHIALDKELARGSRYGFKFSLVFIDLDRFKEINDTFGHLVGSNTLKVVADLLRQCVREVDTLFRYGGDEFTALLVETDKEGAAVVAERIRQTIENNDFRFSDDVAFHLTTTVGFATFPEDASEKENLIDLADRAMYLGKTHRNVTRSARDLSDQ
ncbi:MAG: diguanylate cyclase [Desulfuromonadales bacterium]|nr:diguanylate cyclase [Desulfuromonadales bacterium]NIS42749.1 diguanylate cyclase [Desulfuromonadales bacterium]